MKKFALFLRLIQFAVFASLYFSIGTFIPKSFGQDIKNVVVKNFEFLTDVENWTASSPGVKIQLEPKKGTEKGSGSIKISGNSPAKIFDFAYSPPIPIVAKKKYRVTGKLKVDDLSDAKLPPLLIVNIYSAGKYVKNFWSTKYDMKNKGKWMDVWTPTFDAPEGGNLTAQISLSKSTSDASTGTIFVGLVSLEEAK
jgi:hypothetical protein